MHRWQNDKWREISKFHLDLCKKYVLTTCLAVSISTGSQSRQMRVCSDGEKVKVFGFLKGEQKCTARV